MDRCALFVDAGYVLADGAMAVHGTRRRESVSWDYPGLLELLGGLAAERSGLPLLRTYWYEATAEGRKTAEHDEVADQPGVKVRVAKMRPGRREGVEGEIHRDLTRLARNKAVSDAMVVSAEDDLAQVIADVQDMGLRVTLLQITGDGSATVSRALRQECDEVAEVGADRLRSYVELISGAEPSQPDEADNAVTALRPPAGGAVNGNGHGPAGETSPDTVPQEAGKPEASPAVPAVPAEAAAAPDFGPAPDYKPAAGFAPAEPGPGVDYGSSADYAAVDYGTLDYGSALDYGPVPDYATPAPAPVAVPATPIPPSPIPPSPIPPSPIPAGPVSAPTQAPAAYAYGSGSARGRYQRDALPREAFPRETSAEDPADRLQPVPAMVPSGSAQVRRLPDRSVAPAGSNPAPAPGSPSAPQPVLGAPTVGQQSLSTVPPNGPAPFSAPRPNGLAPGGIAPGPASPAPGGPPVAPVVPMDRDHGPSGMGYPGGRAAAPVGPRPVAPGPGGASGNAGPQAPSVPPGPVLAGPPAPAGAAPSGPIGPIGPIGLVGPGGYPAAAPGVSLGDAVQSAHEEGQAFGESVARDAPALWLEAVLARKPRMPTDLEARLLQGSALPIDFLLHDEVRHALRRGFWDALERARR